MPFIPPGLFLWAFVRQNGLQNPWIMANYSSW
jgi:hypothetical protein